MRTIPLTEDAKCEPCPIRGVHIVCAGQVDEELCGADAETLDGPSASATAAFLAETVELSPDDIPAPVPSPGPPEQAPAVPEGYCAPCKDQKPRGSLDDTIRRGG